MKRKIIGLMCVLVVLITSFAGCKSENNKIKLKDEKKETVNENKGKGEMTTNLDVKLDGTNIDKMLSVLDTQTLTEDNAVYSPISFNTALESYSLLIDNQDTINKINNYIGGKDYLSYKYPGDFYKSINVLWLDSNKEYNKEFVDNRIDIMEIDMSNGDATDIKNNFVKEQTNGFIENTPTEFNSKTVADIMNVTYFKDKWANGSLNTYDNFNKFNNKDGSTTNLDYMIGLDVNHYYKGSDSIAVKLNYKNGMEFWIVLPNNTDFKPSELSSDIANYISNPDAVYQSEKGNDLSVHLRFPEFENNSTIKFEGNEYNKLVNAGFASDFCKYDTVNNITQVARIRVDNEGTEAAAVTEINIKTTAFRENIVEDFDFICNRPFMYFIYDTTNEDIAFIGVNNNIK